MTSRTQLNDGLFLSKKNNVFCAVSDHKEQKTMIPLVKVYALKKQKNNLPDTEPRSKDTYASVASQSEAKVCPQLM
jgi:hypothetical protein